MITKMFEIRDRATCIPVVAIKAQGSNDREDYLFERCGYSPSVPLVILVKLENPEAHWDPYDWTQGRTLQKAHLFIEKNFDNLKNCSVVDVEYLLGETTIAKSPEGGHISW